MCHKATGVLCGAASPVIGLSVFVCRVRLLTAFDTGFFCHQVIISAPVPFRHNDWV